LRGLVAGLVLAAAGCSAPADESIDWVVTSHRGMGRAYSDLTRAGADSLVGRRIRLGTPAVSHDDRCDQPRYVERRVLAEPFMATEYALTAGHVGADAADSLDVLDVFCEGSPWSALGGKVIFTSDVRGYALWEGRLFTIRPMERQ
jgi:hypothetical protein